MKIRYFHGTSSQLLKKKQNSYFSIPLPNLPLKPSGFYCAVSVPSVLLEKISKPFLLPSRGSAWHMVTFLLLPGPYSWACLFPAGKSSVETERERNSLTSEDSPRAPAAASTLEPLQRHPMQFLTAGFCLW